VSWPATDRRLGGGAVEGKFGGPPVVVWGYPCSGLWLLWPMLTAVPQLTCTARSGLLSACGELARAWEVADRRGRSGEVKLTPVAISSIRAAITPLVTVVLADRGVNKRWCDLYHGAPRAAEVLLQIMPGSKFVIMHRKCPDVIWTALKRLDITSIPDFMPAIEQNGGDKVAGVMQYWATHTAGVRAFAGRHPAACLDVRYEDVVDDPRAVAARLTSFLGFEVQHSGDKNPEVPEDLGVPGCGSAVSARSVSLDLRQRVSELHAGLWGKRWPSDMTSRTGDGQ
jgi:hypothetical protein